MHNCTHFRVVSPVPKSRTLRQILPLTHSGGAPSTVVHGELVDTVPGNSHVALLPVPIGKHPVFVSEHATPSGSHETDECWRQKPL